MDCPRTASFVTGHPWLDITAAWYGPVFKSMFVPPLLWSSIQDEDMSANVYRINMYPDKVTAFIFYQRDDFVKRTSSRPAKMQFLATLDGGRTLI